MTKQEYYKKLNMLETEFREMKQKLAGEYVRITKSFSKGDKITDGRKAILVDKIGVAIGFDNLPCPKYSGTELTKKGLPRKDGSRGVIYHQNGDKVKRFN